MSALASNQNIDKVRTAKTWGELRTQLQILRLPLPEKTDMDVILKKDSEAFTNALRSSVNKESDWESSVEYVKTMVVTASNWMRESLRTLGIVAPNPDMLVDIAKQEGATFWKAVKNAIEGGADSKIAAEYVRRTIASISVAQEGQPQESTPAPDNSNDGGAADYNYAAYDATQDRPSKGEKSFGKSVHVYAGKSALCFSEDTNRDGEFTVRIEGAMSSGVRVYDWKGKVSFQLTVQELPLVIGVLHGFMDKLELKGHGRENEKALTIDYQKDKYFISLLCKGEPPRGVPVPAKDIYPVITLLLRQALKNDAFLDTNYILKLSDRICKMHCAGGNTGSRAQG